MSERTLEGGCLCGAIRYKITGAPVMASVCHCAQCRRASAASSVAWAMFNKDQVEFVGGQPSAFASSAGARRGICPNCGTQIYLTANHLPGLIDITVGSLDDRSAITPTRHYWGTRRTPWMQYAYSAPAATESRPVEEIDG